MMSQTNRERSATVQLSFLNPEVLKGLRYTQVAVLIALLAFPLSMLPFSGAILAATLLSLLGVILMFFGQVRCYRADSSSSRRFLVYSMGFNLLSLVGSGLGNFLGLIALLCLFAYASSVCHQAGRSDLSQKLNTISLLLVGAPVLMLVAAFSGNPALVIPTALGVVGVYLASPLAYSRTISVLGQQPMLAL